MADQVPSAGAPPAAPPPAAPPAAPPQATPPAAEPPHEQSVPYERFAAVNAKLKQLEAAAGGQVTAAEQRTLALEAEMRDLKAQLDRDRQALGFARATGVSDPEAFEIAEFYRARLPADRRPASAAEWVSSTPVDQLPRGLQAFLPTAAAAVAPPAAPSWAPPGAVPPAAPSATPPAAPGQSPLRPTWAQVASPPAAPAQLTVADVQQLTSVVHDARLPQATRDAARAALARAAGRG